MRRAATTADYRAQDGCTEGSTAAKSKTPGQNEVSGRRGERRRCKRYREENQANDERRSNSPSFDTTRRERRRGCRDGDADRDRPGDVGDLQAQVLLDGDGQQRGKDARGGAHQDRKSDGHNGPRPRARCPSNGREPTGRRFRADGLRCDQCGTNRALFGGLRMTACGVAVRREIDAGIAVKKSARH